MAESIPMTRAGAEAIKRELKRLKSVERPKNVHDISVARDHGDLRENAEYHAAKERQSHIEGRIQMLEDRLARAFSMVVNFLDPDVIVLGGGLSNIERLYTTVPRLLPKYVYAQTVDTALVRAMHGDASGVRGAAMLWA